MGELTAERLAEIKARCKAAAGGPWEIGIDEELVPLEEADASMAARENAAFPARWICGGGYALAAVGDPLSSKLCDDDKANLAFIAHARQDIPDLLAEVERLRRLLKDADEVLHIAAAGGMFLDPKMASLEAVAAKVERAAAKPGPASDAGSDVR